VAKGPRSAWRASQDLRPPEQYDLDSFARMFDEHASHVFDYCRSLAGRDDVAARATEAALVSARSVPEDPSLLRASLFAAARRQVLALQPADSSELEYPPLDPLPEFPAYDPDVTYPGSGLYGERGVELAAFWTPLDGDHEVLDLVYRHGIHPDDLPAVLGVPADEAYHRLRLAEHVAGSGPGPSPDQLAEFPLASVPDSVWRHSVRAVLAADRQLGRHRGHTRSSVAWPALERRRVRLATMTAIPAAAIIAAGVYVAVPGSSASPPSDPRTHDPASVRAAHLPPLPTPQPTTSTPAPAAPLLPIISLLPNTPGKVVQPVATPPPTIQPTATPAPSASSTAPASSPSPSPTPTDTSSPSPTPTDTSSPTPTDTSSPTDSVSPTPTST